MPSGKEIKGTQRRERRVLLKVDAATPALLLGQYHATLTKNGTGDFSIALNEPGARAIEGLVVGAEADAAGYIESATVSGCDLKITDLAAAAADKDVYVELIIWDSVDEI